MYVELLSHMVLLCLALIYHQTYCTVAAPFCISNSNVQEFLFLHILILINTFNFLGFFFVDTHIWITYIYIYIYTQIYICMQL